MIGKTNAIGINNSNASLNFSVVASGIRPVGKENLIWLNTSVQIAGWVFQSEAPTNVPQNTVWIKIGTSSTVAFNAIKGDNVLKVYPIYCKLYDGSLWNDVEAKIYQNGNWKDWSLIIFVPDEDHKNMFEKKAIRTWHIDPMYGGQGIEPGTSYSTDSYLEVSIANAKIDTNTYQDRTGIIVSKESISVDKYTKVKFEYAGATKPAGRNGGVYFFVAPTTGTSGPSSDFEREVVFSSEQPDGFVEVPIATGLTNAYVGVDIYSNGAYSNPVTIKITQITAI